MLWQLPVVALPVESKYNLRLVKLNYKFHSKKGNIPSHLLLAEAQIMEQILELQLAQRRVVGPLLKEVRARLHD